MMIQLINILGKCKGGGGASLSQETLRTKGGESGVLCKPLCANGPSYHNFSKAHHHPQRVSCAGGSHQASQR